jgi:RHS repeat-associated protein
VRIERYPVANGAEDLAQRTTFTYDTGTGTNLMGRVSEIVYGNPASVPVKERFSYTRAGLVAEKTLVPGSYPALVGKWTWDSEGHMLSAKYPDWKYHDQYLHSVAGEKFVYTYDAMGMAATMALDGGSGVVGSVAYNAAGQMTQMGAYTWSYDARGWLANESGIQYSYGMDGKVVYKNDPGVGQEYDYTYDALGRMKSAATRSGAWGLEWDYDGFGNRYAQRVTKGSALVVSFTVDKTKNRLIGTGFSYDANGNATSTPAQPSLSYDIENRLAGFVYDAANRRLKEGLVYNYYGPSGELMARYEARHDQYSSNLHMALVDGSRRLWFAGRLVRVGDESKQSDRIGSVVAHGNTRVSYYPYGEEVAASQNDGREKFATYRRVSSGLDYAWNRMYSSTYGRFLQADPYRASASMTNPQSWNRYAYVENDPVNFNDRTGLFLSIPDFSSDPLASEQFPCESLGGINNDPGPGNPFFGYSGQLPFLCSTPGTMRPNIASITHRTVCCISVKRRPLVLKGAGRYFDHSYVVLETHLQIGNSTAATDRRVIEGDNDGGKLKIGLSSSGIPGDNADSDERLGVKVCGGVDFCQTIGWAAEFYLSSYNSNPLDYQFYDVNCHTFTANFMNALGITERYPLVNFRPPVERSPGWHIGPPRLMP